MTWCHVNHTLKLENAEYLFLWQATDIVTDISAFSTEYFLRWYSSVFSRVSGDWFKRNVVLGNLRTWTCCVFRSEIQWKRSTSLSFFIIHICRNTWFKSPIITIAYIQFLTKKSSISFCSGGPVSKQPFNDGWFSLGRLDASYTIQSFVLSAVSLITGLQGK